MEDPELSKNDFLSLKDREIAKIIERVEGPRTVVVVPDNTRRTGILYWDMRADSDDFEERLFGRLSHPFIELIRTIFGHGIRTLFIPSLTHGNLSRSRRYVDANLNYATKLILKGKDWLDFYEKHQIRVKVYGDLEYVSELGYPHIAEWAKEVESRTSGNDGHVLFWGYACSSSVETLRLLDMSIDFYREHGAYPTREEKVGMYYGELVDDVDLFIRPGELRDSECQPPLISGNAQMYFPVCPLTEMGGAFFKEILYDYLYCRVITKSRKEYRRSLGKSEAAFLRRYLAANEGAIIGLGERVGDFWVPTQEITTPPSEEQELNA